jgi:hypothetical protein
MNYDPHTCNGCGAKCHDLDAHQCPDEQLSEHDDRLDELERQVAEQAEVIADLTEAPGHEYQWGTLVFDDGSRFSPPKGWALHSWQWPEDCRDIVVVWRRETKP